MAIGKKEKYFLLDALLLPTRLFGTSVEAVVEKFREAKAQLAAFRKFIPRHSKSSSKGDDRSRAEAHRQDQKYSIANRAPPPSRSQQGKPTTNKGKKDLRSVLDKRHSHLPRPEASDHLSLFGSSAVSPFGFN